MNQNYENVSDEELVRRLREGEEGIGDYLLDRYKRTVRSMAHELYLTGGSQEDLLQEGMLGLFKAIRTYDPEKGASFSTYAHLLIARQMYSAIESSNAQKQRPLNSSVSLDEISDEGAEHRTHAAVGEDPETVFVDQESTEDLKKRIYDVLSPLERRVLDDYLDGYDYTEIAERMNRTPKSIDNALQRIRSKVSTLIR